jgi:hypothetical protein
MEESLTMTLQEQAQLINTQFYFFYHIGRKMPNYMKLLFVVYRIADHIITNQQQLSVAYYFFGSGRDGGVCGLGLCLLETIAPEVF